MAMLPKSFNESDISDDILPAGEYLAEVSKTEMKETKSGSGKYLSVQFKILEGKNKGNIVFNNYNLINDNEAAVKIAVRELSKLCTAVGKLHKNVSDSTELHNIPFYLKVDIRPADDAYPGNNVKGYRPAGVGSTMTGSPKKNPFGK